MVAVLDPTALTGFREGLFSVSAEDDGVYLVENGAAPSWAIPLSGVRVLTTLDLAQLSPIGADWVNADGVFIAPGSPIEVGDTLFEGRLAGVHHGESETMLLSTGTGFNIATIDLVAPVLSSPSAVGTSGTEATLTVTTDSGEGTLHWFVSTSATPPTATDLKAGTGAVDFGSQAVSATGAQNAGADGLSASTTYYAHFLHRDASGNESAIATSAGFETVEYAAIVILLGQSLNEWRGSTASQTASGWADAYMPVGGCSMRNFDYVATNLEYTPDWDELSSAVAFEEVTGGQSPCAGITNTIGGGGFAAAYIASAAIGARTLGTLQGAGPRAMLYALVHKLCDHARTAGYVPKVMFYTAHGEADAAAATSESSYYTLGMAYYGMCQLLAQQAMEDPDYDAPVFFTYPLQTSGGGSGARDIAIKEAIRRIADDLTNGVDLGAIYDMPANTDRVHPTEASYVLRGERIGKAMREWNDNGSTSEALEIVSVTLSGATATVTFNKAIQRDATIGAGQNLNTSLAEDGFEWIDNGSAIAVNSVAYPGGAVATLTLASTPVGTLAQQVCRIASQTTSGTASGIDNIAGSVVRSTEAGWASVANPSFTNYVWAAPQAFDGVA